MSHDIPPSDRQICALNTIGQFIDINNIMPWLDVCFFVFDFSRLNGSDFKDSVTWPRGCRGVVLPRCKNLEEIYTFFILIYLTQSDLKLPLLSKGILTNLLQLTEN